MAFERTPVGMSFVSADREVLLTNPAMSKILGYSARELRGMSIAEVTPTTVTSMPLPTGNSSRVRATGTKSTSATFTATGTRSGPSCMSPPFTTTTAA